MNSTSRATIHEATQTTRQGLAQYQSRKLARALEFDEAEVALNFRRKKHPGSGLIKIWEVIDTPLGRDNFVCEMTRRGYALPAVRNYMRTTRSSAFRFPHLTKNLVISAQDQVWQSDTTYFWVEDTFQYLTFIIDVYTRYIVGYSVSTSLRAEANVRALKMALKKRKGKNLMGLILHSDGGTQYRYHPFTNLLRSHGISSSMCIGATDNAYAERLNGVVKDEYLAHWSITNTKELERLTLKAVKDYNEDRPHGSLPGRVSPAEYERQLAANQLGSPRYQIIKDGQAQHLDWTPPSLLENLGVGMWAPRDTLQIMPANIILHQPMIDPQLVLDF